MLIIEIYVALKLKSELRIYFVKPRDKGASKLKMQKT